MCTIIKVCGYYSTLLIYIDYCTNDCNILLFSFSLSLFISNKRVNIIIVVIFVGEDVLPVADAGPDIMITLPQDTVTLNGTGSHDGFGISQYKWIKSDSSPAIGNY